MLELLTDQPVFTADGGGVARTIMRTMHVHKGVLAILTSPRVLRSLRERMWKPAFINGEPQLALMKDGQVTEVLCLEMDASGSESMACISLSIQTNWQLCNYELIIVMTCLTVTTQLSDMILFKKDCRFFVLYTV